MIEPLPLLISNIVIACALALVATFIGWSGKHAALCRWIWIAVFVKLITPPLIPLPIEFPNGLTGRLQSVSGFLNEALITVPTSAQLVEANENLSGRSPTAAENQYLTLRWWARALSPVSILVVLWAGGAVWLLGRGVQRYWRTLKLLREQAIHDEAGTEIVRELLNRQDTRTVPQVRLIPARISPMLFGIGRSLVIVCPQQLWLSLDWQQRTAFLAHEAAHYQRRDHWVRWLEWFVTSLYWWLPLVYWARMQLERHEEVACDRQALQLLHRTNSQPLRRTYAEALLNVVDFLSETHAAVPRLASRMQPTACLEERLHWIMSDNVVPLPGWVLVATAVTGASGLLVHPIAHRPTALANANNAAALSNDVISHTVDHQHSQPDPAPVLELEVHPRRAELSNELPPVPKGWWNSGPETQWIDQELGTNRLQVQAHTDTGLRVSQHGQTGYTFDTRDVRSLAYIADTDRMIVGRRNGELHVWDSLSSRSVSLIGKHAGDVTSTSWSAAGGLVSSDRLGNVIRWDIQSGQMLASINLDEPVSAVRWSSDGSEVAVLIGAWSAGSWQRRIQFLDPSSLQRTHSQVVAHTVASLHHDARLGWLTIDWTGGVSQLTTGQMIGAMPKHAVSGAVLCGDLVSLASFVVPAAAQVPPSGSEPLPIRD